MKYLVLLFTFTGFLLACTNSQQKSTEKAMDNKEIKQLVHAEINIQGMSCTGCENTIKNCVSSLEGVNDVTASYVDGKAIVEFDSAAVNLTRISEAINKTGYTVTGYEVIQ